MSYLDKFKGVTINAPVKKSIKYIDAQTREDAEAEVYVKQYGIADARRLLEAAAEKDRDKDLAIAELISANILVEKSEKNKELVSIGTAQEILDAKLSDSFVLALLTAISEVNSPKKPS